MRPISCRSPIVIGYSPFRHRARFAFTILELLIVISIVIALAGLTIATMGYVQNKGARSRAEAEIAAISAALENYKADNGLYPRGNGNNPAGNTPPFDTDKLDARTDGNPSVNGPYAPASLFLYAILSGDQDADGRPDAGFKTYMQFKDNQLARTNMSQAPAAGNKVLSLRDPFGNAYGYSTAYQGDVDKGNPPTHGYNPTFDLWSTAGTITTPADPTRWIKNW